MNLIFPSPPRSGRVVIELKQLDAAPTSYSSPLQVFETALEHERAVTAAINELYDLVANEKDFASQAWLDWFATEQVEEEKTVGQIVDDLKRVSNGDAQRAAYNWGTAEMVSFKNIDGVPLKGVLLKPDNFDPKKKYPMIVYIYERLSQGLHQFRNPGPGTSINPTFYASTGYLVLMPDIAYDTGSRPSSE